MNILAVTPYLPQPTWGTSKRSYHLLQALACRHTVSLLALVGDDEYDQSMLARLLPDAHTVRRVVRPAGRSKRFDQIRALAAGRSYFLSRHTVPAAQAALDEELARCQYDAILYEGLGVAGLRVPRGVRIILDEHNIEHELLRRVFRHSTGLARRGFNWIEYRRVKPLEIAWCDRADLVLVTSERERDALQALLPESSIRVVPNGVDIDAFSADAGTVRTPGRIIFTASFDYYPNVQGALYFAERCWPQVRRANAHATWQLVGRNPPPEIAKLGEYPGITVTGSVPDIQPYLAEAEVAIVPLLSGGGTRLKILEAMAMHCAVVSTTIGCEGIDCVPDRHLLVADDPTDFASLVIELLQNPGRRADLAKASRTLVEERYSWEYCGDRLLAALDEVIENG
jgi:glycosyltransferase involved in cell wall biosynthesis